jgi:hypothetical protein
LRPARSPAAIKHEEIGVANPGPGDHVEAGGTAQPKAALETAPPPPPAADKPAHEKSRHHQVTFVAYPKLLYIWPLLLAGFLFWLLGQWGWVSDAWLGWIYIWIAVIVVLTIGVDVNRNQTAFWVILVALFWVAGLWLKDVKGITVFGDIYKWFQSLNVHYDRGLGLSLSTLLLIPYVLMLGWARLNDRWRITHNEFEHYSFGRLDDSLGRGAKTIRCDFPDMFELLLGMAGTLIVYNASGTQELRRISNVLFLPLVRKRLDKILEKTAITQISAQDEEDET